MMPSPLQLIPGLDDPLGKEEAIKYIQATEQEIKEFQAKDSTGEITFTVRAERSGVYSARTYNAIPSSSEEPFLITCDNDTAVYEDGVLTFTGDGTISVIPQDQLGGTLVIEDSEGNTYTYVIDVVEQHDCTAGEQQVVVKPFSPMFNRYNIKQKGMSGCTILGDGSITIILDIGNIILDK
jgi:chemotaxis protein histidine kinase CheA